MSTKTQLIAFASAIVYHVAMPTDMKRIAVFVPEEVYEALLTATERSREPLSSLGRRLFIEWLENEHPALLSPPDPRPSSDQ